MATTALFLTSACVPQAQPPAAPPPAPIQPPPAPPPPAPVYKDWRDAPVSPGTWRWSLDNGQSVARFAEGGLELRCNRAEGTILLLRAGTGQGQVPMTILTEAGSTPLLATPLNGPRPALAVTFSTRNPLLDAMAFSRGRFVVEVAGLPSLYVPSWPEISRIIEDCR